MLTLLALNRNFNSKDISLFTYRVVRDQHQHQGKVFAECSFGSPLWMPTPAPPLPGQTAAAAVCPARGPSVAQAPATPMADRKQTSWPAQPAAAGIRE